jgi:hypothetical protein
VLDVRLQEKKNCTKYRFTEEEEEAAAVLKVTLQEKKELSLY